MDAPWHAINSQNQWVVFNESTNKVVESHFSRNKAEQAADDLNAHEQRNRREPVYVVRARVGV